LTKPKEILVFLSLRPTKNNNIEQTIISIGPIPGKINPKLEVKLLGSKTPERNGVTLIKPSIIVGYSSFIIADTLKLIKFSCELTIDAIKKIVVKEEANSPKYIFQVYKLLNIYMWLKITPPLS
jgi:hypothetical protein